MRSDPAAAEAADPQATLLQQWQPVIGLVVNAVQGDAAADNQLLPFLDQLSRSADWHNLAAALRRVLAGERNLQVLSPGLDATDQAILTATLDALQSGSPPDIAPAVHPDA
ncbi:MAG: hypothetical protein HZY76_13555 [Anaerolineae bacterium]|nr:MAG: hypothetical protein HZY76_13555 [Anaerolineae bacterium]